MKIFVWNRLEQVSQSYHCEGGLVIVAETLERAREMIKTQLDNGNIDCDGKSVDPTETYNLGGFYAEKLTAFPDAGCC